MSMAKTRSLASATGDLLAPKRHTRSTSTSTVQTRSCLASANTDLEAPKRHTRSTSTAQTRSCLASATTDLEAPKRHTRSTSTAQNQNPKSPLSSLAATKKYLSSASTSSAQNLKTPFSSQTASIVSATGKSVFLKDWWLIKVNGKGLAVGGFASRLGIGVREYSSSVISRRQCATTLETDDGITITIDGLLNMSRTHQNGFPLEVCSQFLHGFPYNWEEHGGRNVLRTCTVAESNLFSEELSNNSLPSLNDLPVSAIRDCLLSSLGHTDYDFLINSIYNDTLRTSRNDTFENSGAPKDSNAERKRSVRKKKSGANDSLITQHRNVGIRTRSMCRMMNP